MTHSISPLPEFYKGIALFTPGGDLIYAIDPKKQDRWHLHLCFSLQEILGLSEPPHFLIPAYTATIDRWRDRVAPLRVRGCASEAVRISGEIKVSAEIYPPVKRYLPLLQVLFEQETWHLANWQEEYCDPNLIETNKAKFPQLWQQNDLILRLQPEQLNHSPLNLPSEQNASTVISQPIKNQSNTGYVLRLFISHDNVTIEKTLNSIHQVLEKGLTQPYTLKIIDISKNPEQAESDRISATPALVRVFPKPVKKIVGELDDVQKILKIISS